MKMNNYYLIIGALCSISVAGNCEASTYTYTVSNGFTVNGTDNPSTNSNLLRGLTSISVPGFDPSFGTLQSITPKSKGVANFTLEAKSSGSRVGTAATVLLYSTSYTPSDIDNLFNGANLYPRLSGSSEEFQIQNGESRAFSIPLTDRLISGADPKTSNPVVLADFTSNGDVSVGVGGQFGSNFSQNITDAISTGVFSVTYEFAPAAGFDFTPYLVGRNPLEPFSGEWTLTPLDTIGFVQSQSGNATVKRENGNIETINPGTVIGSGDIVETELNSNVDILFIDGSSFNLNEDSKIAIDEYVFDPNEPQIDYRSELLKAIFLFTSDLLDNGELRQGTCGPDHPCSLGIRGDAADIIFDELERNPDESLGDVGIRVETASPSTITTVIDANEGERLLSFDYAFLDEGSNLSVFLDDQLVFSSDAMQESLLDILSYETLLDWDGISKKLSFTLDGDADLSVIISRILFDGIDLTESAYWTGAGAGAKEYVYLLSETDYNSIKNNISTVPIPASWLMLMLGLAFLFMRQHSSRSFD